MRKGLIAYFAGNPVAANLLMLLLIVGGLLAGSRLAVQLFPELDLRTVSVTVQSPGSSPTEVQEDITRRVEESVIGLPGVDRVVSTATENLGEIDVELATFADAETVLDDVQNAVDSIENFPPVTAEQPEVELKRTELEVMTLAVSSSVVSENTLRLAAEDLRDKLLELPAVSHATLFGTRDREIAIELSEEELRRNNLSIAQMTKAIRRASLNLTFGELRTAGGSVMLHTVVKRHVGEEFKDIPLITHLDGTIVTLGDVADVRDRFVDEDVRTEVDGVPAIFVRIDATQQQSIVDIADNVKRWLATYQPLRDVTVTIWNDKAKPTIDRISNIVRNAVIGAILVFILLMFVFDLRVATWITVGIPLSFIGSLMFFGSVDLTLNMVTLFGFFLMVGLVVDDAVVVGESIAAERESGKSALDAAIAGAKAMVGPITIGAATTMIAFFPFFFITQGNYQIMQVLPYVAVFVLLVSLIEAFFILPAHLSHEGNWSLPPLSHVKDRVCAWLEEIRDDVVVPAVSWAVRHVALTPFFGVLIVLAGLLLLRSETVRVIVFDEAINAGDNVQADLSLPVGTPFEATLATAERFVNAAHAVNKQSDGTPVNAVSIVVGNIVAPRTSEEGANRSHLASVRVHLNDRPVRTTSPQEIERMWRRNIGDVSYLQNVEFHTTRVRAKPNVAYAIKHDDLDVLKKATAELRASIATIPGMYGISDSLSLGKRHFEIELTPAGKAAGLTPAAIGAQLRANFHGAEVQRIQRGHEEIKVMVRYPRERRRSLRELAGERITRPNVGRNRPGGGEIPLAMAARLTEKRKLATLTRIDGKQTALLNARADAAVITPIQARRAINTQFIPGLVAKYPGLKIEVDGGARDEKALLKTLGLLVPIILLAMYALMAAFLRSYWKPVIAVAGIPVAFSGAVFSHWILGWDFTAMSLFGVIAVGGVIMNDALVLLDRYNTIRRDNSAIPAIAVASAAARHRFRAVFLTSLTTVFGLSPLLYERSDQLVFLVPFVVSMLGGLVFSGLFVLFLLPTLVMIAEGRHE